MTPLALLLLLAFSSAYAAKPRTRLLAPPPKSFETYAKVSGLWQGNKLMYCSSYKAVVQTLKEIKQLNEVKTATYDARTSEIKIQTRSGEKGAIDVDNAPTHKPGELCVN